MDERKGPGTESSHPGDLTLPLQRAISGAPKEKHEDTAYLVPGAVRCGMNPFYFTDPVLSHRAHKECSPQNSKVRRKEKSCRPHQRLR